MRVLLLEDDVDLRRSFAHRLRRDGHTVDEVATVERARAAYGDGPYDCLVLDRFVPDGDALDLVASFDRKGQHPLVILVSAMGEADHRIAGLEAGADDYLSKPVRLNELSLAGPEWAGHRSRAAGRAATRHPPRAASGRSRRDLFSNPLRSQITRLRQIFRGVLRFPSVSSIGYRFDLEDSA